MNPRMPEHVKRNPATGTTVVVPAARYLAFKASPKALEPRIP